MASESQVVVSTHANPQPLVESPQLSLNWAAQRDAGIARAEVHAERVEPGWQAIAYGMLEEFCLARRGCYFTSEDVRRWCELRGFDSPVPKAWGGIFLKGSRRGLIKKTGTAIAKQRHGSPCPQWEAA